jgi:hypothetical protein
VAAVAAVAGPKATICILPIGAAHSKDYGLKHHEEGPNGTAGFETACKEEAKEALVAKRKKPKKCEHGRDKHRCKDCGTSYCQHGREKHRHQDCGTG